MTPDAYEVLDLDPTAQAHEIEERYHFLIAAFHPDRFARSPRFRAQAELRAKLINEAYQILSDPHQRAQYDQAHPIRKTNNDTQLREVLTHAERKLIRLEKELGKARDQLQWIKSEKSALMSRVDELKKENKELTATFSLERQQLQAELRSVGSELQQTKDALRESRAQVDELEAAVQLNATEIDRLRNRPSKSDAPRKAYAEELTRRERESDVLRRELAHARNVAEEATYKARQEAKAEYDALHGQYVGQLQDMEWEVRDLRDQLSQSVFHGQRAEKAVELNRSKAEELHNTLEKERARFQASLTLIGNEMERVQRQSQSMTAQIQQLTAELSERQAELEFTQTQLAEAKNVSQELTRLPTEDHNSEESATGESPLSNKRSRSANVKRLLRKVALKLRTESPQQH